MGDILYEGQAPYHIPAFFSELAKGLSSTELSSVDLKRFVDSINVVFNNKVAEEKKRDTSKKNQQKKEKPRIALDNSRNNNPQMVADLMGDEDDYGDEYGDEYGDYGDEAATGGGAKKVKENTAAYDDFM